MKPRTRNLERRTESAFGLLEMIAAIGVWIVIISAGVGMLLGGLRVNRLADESALAAHIASEGLDSVNSIKKQGWTSPFLATACISGCGLATASGTWGFSGTNNVIGKFTRQIFVTDVNRDGSNNIVTSGGTLDADTHKIESRVSWSRGIPPVSNTVSLISYVSNFVKNIGAGGMLVYGDGGTTSDAIKFKTFDGTAWSVAAAMADVDTGATNKYLRAIRVYSSSTRNEKVAVSRHYNGTTQHIYFQVYNGGTGTWGNVGVGASWTAATFLDVQNFDGTYLANGDFMVVYSDNTATPKMKIWNGTAWSAAVSLNAVTGTPVHIRIAARPGTNEVMAGFLTTSNNSSTEYFGGGTYVTASWSAVTVHANVTVLNTKRTINFRWSTNTPTIGIFGYSSQANDKKITVKAFQANGLGGGTWGAASNAANQTNNVGASMLADRPGANEMNVCDKDGAATPTIVCRTLTFSGTTITWITPTNPIVGATSDTGIQRSFDLAYEGSTGALALNVYGDNTTTPKYKKYTPGTTTWDVAATSMGVTAGAVKTVRLAPKPSSDDMLVFVSDANLDVYSYIWDGTANTMGTSTTHGTNGSAITDYWYDFVWD